MEPGQPWSLVRFVSSPIRRRLGHVTRCSKDGCAWNRDLAHSSMPQRNHQATVFAVKLWVGTRNLLLRSKSRPCRTPRIGHAAAFKNESQECRLSLRESTALST